MHSSSSVGSLIRPPPLIVDDGLRHMLDDWLFLLSIKLVFFADVFSVNVR